jgi:hypothetical protein
MKLAVWSLVIGFGVLYVVLTFAVGSNGLLNVGRRGGR